MQPEPNEPTGALVRAVCSLLHAIDVDPMLGRGLRDAVAQVVARAAGPEPDPEGVRLAVARVHADVGLIACRVGLCPPVTAALAAVQRALAWLDTPRGGPVWRTVPQVTGEHPRTSPETRPRGACSERKPATGSSSPRSPS